MVHHAIICHFNIGIIISYKGKPDDAFYFWMIDIFYQSYCPPDI